MTETDWLNSTDPQAMLNFLREGGRLSDRKARLFEVACCRRIWPLLADDRSRRAVELAEQYADGLAALDQLQALARGAMEATWAIKDQQDTRRFSESAFGTLEAAEAAEMAAWASQTGRVWGADGGYGAWEAVLEATTQEAKATVQHEEADLLRCVFGNLFRPRPPAEAAWNDGTVRKLAEAIYEEWAFERMPLLADALEEAGCTNEDIISHCREPGGGHVRGCWVVDLLLGKE